MYVVTNSKIKTKNAKAQKPNNAAQQIKIITVWRYPGKSPERNPIPKEILQETMRVLKI
jgi:hypothetical protein